MVKKTRKWVTVLILSYWIPLILSGLIHLYDSRKFLLSIGVFWAIQLVCIILFKFLMDCDKVRDNSWVPFIEDFVLYGTFDLAGDILMLSHELTDRVAGSWLMKLWWSFSIKYNIALILWHMIVFNLADHVGLGGDRLWGSRDAQEEDVKHLRGWEIITMVYIFLFLLILIIFWCLALPQEVFENKLDKTEEEASSSTRKKINDSAE